MQISRITKTVLFQWILHLIAVSLCLAQSDLAERLKFETHDGEGPLKCGLPLILEAAVSPDASTRALLAERHSGNLRQLSQTYLSPSGRFLIYYETGGPHAIPGYDRDGNGTPDYLEFVAKSFDRAWEVEIDSLGFNPPPDSTGAPHTAKYPVFCKSLGNTYGLTSSDDDLGGGRYSSFIEINTSFSFITYPDITNDPIVRDSLAIAVTAAHEFNHALQFGYRIWIVNNQYPDLWFIESSATYMEEVVAAGVNDYINYLNCIFRSTDLHLTANNICGRIYGEAVLHIMLGELYGKEITREVWAEIVNQPAIQSLGIRLQQKGSSLNGEMRRWATWMFFTGGNAIPGEFYPEGDLYPDPDVIELDPVSLAQNPTLQVYEGELPSLAFQLFKIPVVATGDVLVLIAPENQAASWSGSQLFFDDPFYAHFSGRSPFLTNFAPPSGDIYLAAASGGWDIENTAAPVSYNITLKATGEGRGDEVLVGPNPVKSPQTEGGLVTFLNLPKEAVIEIFNSNGVRVATVRPENSGQIAYWNLQSNNDQTVGSGVYIYRIVSPEKNHSGKIMVIR